MKKRKPPVAAPAAAPRAPVADMTNEEINPPDMPIATFVTNQSAVAAVVATGPRDRRQKIIHFTFPNGDKHSATMGAVFVLRELCNQVITNCGTDCLIPKQETAPAKEPA